MASFFAILDTGSQDATLDIVRSELRASGVPFRIAEAPFTRFDEARNAAADLVPPEIDWILMLDADEELDASEYLALLDLLDRAEARVYALPRYNYWDWDRAIEPSPYPDRQRRLFRNGRDRVRYAGAVHETIMPHGSGFVNVPLDSALIGGDRGGPHIHHFVRMVRTPEEEQAKQHQYRELARAS